MDQNTLTSLYFIGMAAVGFGICIAYALYIRPKRNGNDSGPADPHEPRPNEASVPQVFYQLRAEGSGYSVKGTVYRAGSKVYETPAEAEAESDEFLREVTTLRVGRMDAIHPDNCEVSVARVEMVGGR